MLVRNLEFTDHNSETVELELYDTSGQGNNCLLNALFSNLSEGSAITIKDEERTKKMREEIREFLENCPNLLNGNNSIKNSIIGRSYEQLITDLDKGRQIGDLVNNKDPLLANLIPIIMFLSGIEKVTLYIATNNSPEFHNKENVKDEEYTLPESVCGQVTKKKEVWGDSNAKEHTILWKAGHYSRVKVINREACLDIPTQGALQLQVNKQSKNPEPEGVSNQKAEEKVNAEPLVVSVANETGTVEKSNNTTISSEQKSEQKNETALKVIHENSTHNIKEIANPQNATTTLTSGITLITSKEVTENSIASSDAGVMRNLSRDPSIDSGQAVEQPNETPNLQTEPEDNKEINTQSLQGKSCDQPIDGLNSNTQTKPTSSKAYAIGIGCGMVVGAAIAYLVGAAALTPAIAAVALFIAAAVVGALVGYSIGKFYEKVSEEKQNNPIRMHLMLLRAHFLMHLLLMGL